MNETFPILFINCFFNIFALYIPETAFLSKPFTRHKHIIYVLILVAISLCSYHMQIHNLIYIAISLFAIYILTDRNILCLTLSMVGYITAIFYNYVFMEIFCFISGLEFGNILHNFFYVFIFNTTYIVSLYLLLKFLKLIPASISRIFAYSNKGLFAGLVFFLIFAICTFVLYFSYEEKLDYPKMLTSYNKLFFVSFFAFTTIIFFIVTITVYNDAKARQSLKEMEYLRKYTFEVENLYNSIRGFRHDYLNILYSMKDYIDNDDIQGLKSYYYSNITPLSETLTASGSAIERLTNIKIPEIKSILYIKILEAGKLNIKINLEANWPIEHINMQMIDLTRILGIFIDNALEAVKDLGRQDQHINIAFICDKDNIIIIISNPTSESSISLGNLKKQGASTKGKGRGTGLYNVSEIMAQYKNALLTTQLDKKVFTQTLEITNTDKL